MASRPCNLSAILSTYAVVRCHVVPPYPPHVLLSRLAGSDVDILRHTDHNPRNRLARPVYKNWQNQIRSLDPLMDISPHRHHTHPDQPRDNRHSDLFVQCPYQCRIWALVLATQWDIPACTCHTGYMPFAQDRYKVY